MIAYEICNTIILIISTYFIIKMPGALDNDFTKRNNQ